MIFNVFQQCFKHLNVIDLLTSAPHGGVQWELKVKVLKTDEMLKLGLSKWTHSSDYVLMQWTRLQQRRTLSLATHFEQFVQVIIKHVQIGSWGGSDRQQKKSIMMEDAKRHVSPLDVQTPQDGRVNQHKVLCTHCRKEFYFYWNTSITLNRDSLSESKTILVE